MALNFVRVGLSFIVGLGCWFGQVHAQTPGEPVVVSVRVVNAEEAPHAPATAAATTPQRPLRDLLNRCGYCCAQELNWYGCGGWRQQNLFVFGSCRTFFFEPCIPKDAQRR